MEAIWSLPGTSPPVKSACDSHSSFYGHRAGRVTQDRSEKHDDDGGTVLGQQEGHPCFSGALSHL